MKELQWTLPSAPLICKVPGVLILYTCIKVIYTLHLPQIRDLNKYQRIIQIKTNDAPCMGMNSIWVIAAIFVATSPPQRHNALHVSRSLISEVEQTRGNIQIRHPLTLNDSLQWQRDIQWESAISKSKRERERDHNYWIRAVSSVENVITGCCRLCEGSRFAVKAAWFYDSAMIHTQQNVNN